SSSSSSLRGATEASSSSVKGLGPPLPECSCASSPFGLPVLTVVDLQVARAEALQRVSVGGDHDDVAVRFLAHAHQLELHQLQQREEGDDDVATLDLPLEELEELLRPVVIQPRGHGTQGLGEAEMFADHLVLLLRGHLLQQPVERL